MIMRINTGGKDRDMTPEEELEFMSFMNQPLTLEQADSILEKWSNEVAQGRGYKNADRLLSYQNSTNMTWKSEADAFRAWWDNIWIEAQNLQSLVQASSVPAPKSRDELLSHFTNMVWPL